jgi:DNA-binding HxlR family transcriptional regulator
MGGDVLGVFRAGAAVTAAPLDRALARVGDRWTLLLVEALLEAPRRYGELAAAVAGIAPNILAARLKRLEQDGLVTATPYSERPRRLRYALTADGRELAAALSVLAAWAARVEGLPPPRYHATCGTALESRPWCPTCTRTVDDNEADELDRL